MQPLEETEIKKFVDDVQLAVKFRFAGYGGFGILILILKLLGVYPAPWMMFFILFSLSIYTLAWRFLFKNPRGNIDRLSIIYFGLQTIEIIFILIALHVTQITAFIGAFTLIIYFLHAQFPFTKRRYSWATLIFCVASYSTVIILEYLGILKTYDLHNVGATIENNKGLLAISLPVGAALMFFVSAIMGSFSTQLQNSLKTLSQKEQELQEAKNILEVRVMARTRELEIERESLDQKVKEKTKELQEKVEELSKINALTIGREIKMVELKGEIEKLKKELGQK